MAENKHKKTEESLPAEARALSQRSITTEMKESYLDYAMSVITSRALPDVRDGLSPCIEEFCMP